MTHHRMRGEAQGAGQQHVVRCPTCQTSLTDVLQSSTLFDGPDEAMSEPDHVHVYVPGKDRCSTCGEAREHTHFYLEDPDFCYSCGEARDDPRALDHIVDGVPIVDPDYAPPPRPDPDPCTCGAQIGALVAEAIAGRIAALERRVEELER